MSQVSLVGKVWQWVRQKLEAIKVHARQRTWDSRLAISSAVSAASLPLLPALPPARSWACGGGGALQHSLTVDLAFTRRELIHLERATPPCCCCCRRHRSRPVDCCSASKLHSQVHLPHHDTSHVIRRRQPVWHCLVAAQARLVTR